MHLASPDERFSLPDLWFVSDYRSICRPPLHPYLPTHGRATRCRRQRRSKFQQVIANLSRGATDRQPEAVDFIYRPHIKPIKTHHPISYWGHFPPSILFLIAPTVGYSLWRAVYKWLFVLSVCPAGRFSCTGSGSSLELYRRPTDASRRSTIPTSPEHFVLFLFTILIIPVMQIYCLSYVSCAMLRLSVGHTVPVIPCRPSSSGFFILNPASLLISTSLPPRRPLDNVSFQSSPSCPVACILYNSLLTELGSHSVLRPPLFRHCMH